MSGEGVQDGEGDEEGGQALNKELNYNSAALSIPFDKTIVKHTEEDFQNFEVFDTAAFEQPPDARHLTRKNKHFGLFKQQYDRNLQAVLTKCEEDDDLLIRDELHQDYQQTLMDASLEPPSA